MTDKALIATTTYEKSDRQAQITHLLASFEKVWRSHPDLRMCQLIYNVSGAIQPAPEVFYAEDQEVLLNLAGLIKTV